MMHWCLLFVASSMGNKENRRLLPRAAPLTHLPTCDVFLAPSTIPGTGLGVFAGRAFNKDEMVIRTWTTLFLRHTIPENLIFRHYIFGLNMTHVILPLDYGSILNHHKSANMRQNNTNFHATKDIAAGQELFYRYGDVRWFKTKNISHTEVDYANTMWRPDLQPLPCRKDVIQTIAADGRRTYAVREAVASGAVVEISLCLVVPLVVVDQLPYLWDFVLTDQDEGGNGQRPKRAVIPLSYAAQIPTTRDPDMANVRVSVSRVDHQVKGSAKIIVTVVATRELEPGDVLRRFKAAEDGPSRYRYTFSAQSRDELKHAVDDCLGLSSEGYHSTRLRGPISEWNVSQVVNMSKIFFSLRTFNYELSKWDVSRVTTMRGMFADARSFNQDLSKWDVFRVTDMSGMFTNAYSFNQDLSKWDVSRVTDMRWIFSYAIAFNQDLFKWDVSRVTTMRGMFANAIAFKRDLSKWDVSRVTTMCGMFANAKFFNQDLSKWNVSRVNNIGGMFAHVKFFNQDLSKWDVSRVTDMSGMFVNATNFNEDLSKWDVSRVTDMRGMLSNATYFNQDLSKWDVSRVTDMCEMFKGASSFQQTLCGAAWVNSNASKLDMFVDSPGSISKTVCVFSPQSMDELKHAVDTCL